MRYILAIFLSVYHLLSFGVDSSPQLLRACINFTNNTVTISWKTPTDNCGSFTKYNLYAKPETGTFTQLAEINNIATNEYLHSLTEPNTKWQYYLATNFACDNSTLLISDTIAVDITYPENIQLDSVSYDLNTQDIIAGWQPNPSIDTKRYELFDFRSGDGDSIGTTIETNFNISQARSGRFPIVLATIDSCSLSSLLSTPHSPSYLQAGIDTCEREITLKWNTYIGWSAVDSQSVYVSKDKINYTKVSNLGGNINRYIFTELVLGDTISFYIRSYTNKGKITSSSNIVTISTRNLVVPDYLYLANVTVNDAIGNNQAPIALEWETTKEQDIELFQINYGLSPNTLIINHEVKSTNSSVYNLIDTKSDGKTQSVYYQIVAYDKCKDPLIISQISQSIHLDISPLIVHNEYINWKNNVDEYQLLKHDGSTWKQIISQNNPFTFTDFTDSSGCYKVVAIEQENSPEKTATSHSNIICFSKPLVYEVPSGVNPNSDNNRFIVVGQGIDHNKSHYAIYNRWGQRIANNPTNKPWYLDYQGKHVQNGIYLYTLEIHSETGIKEITKGTFNVIR